MTDGAVEPVSPLGAPERVAEVRARLPVLAERIDDLESIVTPEFDRADRDAIETQSRMKRSRLTEMGGGALVAVLALVRLGVGDGARWAGAAAAVIAAGTAVIAVAGRRHSLDQWLDSRRIAEELRSLYFRWLVSEPPTDRRDRRQLLRREVGSIIDVEPVRVGRDLTGQPVTGETVLDEATWRLYRDARLRDQLDWMRNRARRVGARSRQLQTAQLVLLAGASVCGLLSSFVTGDDGRLLAVPVAATAALVGFLATVDALTASERLAEHYARTVRRLEVIDRALADEVGTIVDVEEIEEVLLSEHRTWHRIAEGNQP